MTSAANAQLRSLVSDYYHGLVSFQSYREQRGSILDGLGSQAPAGAARPVRAAPAQAPREKPQARTVAPAPPQSASPPAPNVRSSRRWLGWAGVAAAAAVIAAGGWIAFDRPPSVPATAAGNESPTLPPGAALLEQFMQRNAWDRDAVRNLEVAWGNALTEEQRQAAFASATYGRFSDSLRLRLREEEALSGLEGSAELETLAELAGRFEVPYSRTAARTASRNGAGAAAPSVAEAAQASPDETAAPVSADERSAEAADETVATAVPASLAAEPVAPPTEGAAPTGAETATGTAAVPAESSSAAAPPAAAGSAGPAPACSAALLNTRRPYCSDTLRSGGTGPALAIVPPGEFEMGGDQTNDEKPAHRVAIGAALAMSVYEISFAEFGVYCKVAGQRCPENPWASDDFPVALVSWDEAVAYAEWLSAETGQSYRLPSEAEWEYAARAGSRTRYPFGDDVTPVAARSSANGAVDSPLANTDRSVNRNQFRLFHMIGNVREWVADHWQSGYAGAPTDGTARLGTEAALRVVRGGAYSDGPLPLRSAARASLERGTRDRLTGFRLVRELPL